MHNRPADGASCLQRGDQYVAGCKCDLPQIKVTEQCTCNTQQEGTPHYCQNYEEK